MIMIKMVGIFASLLLVTLVPSVSWAQRNLTGTWAANDGGIYYIRQIGDTLWWAGMSTESNQGRGDFHRGLRFMNIFRGRITGDTIMGEWADVPRGQILQNGTLTLRIVELPFPIGVILRKEAETGGFGGSTWNVVIPSNPPTCDNITASSPDIRCKFNRVRKNGKNTLYEDLKPEKDNVVVFGWTTTSLGHSYPLNVGRSITDWFCRADEKDDGDITFHMRIDRPKLDSQPNFWTEGWLYSNGSNQIKNKLNYRNRASSSVS